MNSQQEALLRKYADAVVNAPMHLHLTADREAELFWNRHILDAVQLLEKIPPTLRVQDAKALDIGSGNGIPGIVIAILEPQWQIDLLDSDSKKCGFLDTFCKNNGLKNVRVIMERAESLAHTDKRASYNVAFARAVGRLSVALELSSAYVEVGGAVIVPHGTNWKSDMPEYTATLDVLGLDSPIATSYKLGEVYFYALVFKKVKETPNLYPRAIGIPTKRPL